MGQDKALMPHGRGTLVDHALSLARAVTPDVRILCGPSRRYEDFGVPVVEDAVCGVGPVAGLYSGLLSASVDEHEGMFWLAVDLPLVPKALLGALVAGLGHADVVMARTSRGHEPLCAAFRTEPVLACVRRALLDSRLKLTEAFEGLRVEPVDADLAAFTNINTKADYDALNSVPRTT